MPGPLIKMLTVLLPLALQMVQVPIPPLKAPHCSVILTFGLLVNILLTSINFSFRTRVTTSLQPCRTQPLPHRWGKPPTPSPKSLCFSNPHWFFPITSYRWTQCLCFPKVHMVKSNSQWDGIWKQGLGEVIRSGGLHPPEWDCALSEEVQEPVHPPPAVWGPGRRFSPCTGLAGILTSASRTVRNKFLLLIASGLWVRAFRYSSLSWLNTSPTLDYTCQFPTISPYWLGR